MMQHKIYLAVAAFIGTMTLLMLRLTHHGPSRRGFVVVVCLVMAPILINALRSAWTRRSPS